MHRSLGSRRLRVAGTALEVATLVRFGVRVPPGCTELVTRAEVEPEPGDFGAVGCEGPAGMHEVRELES